MRDPNLSPPLLASQEILTHFQCTVCHGWWSIGDFEVHRDALMVTITHIYCPWCGAALPLPDPLVLME